ncbi:hypothetical protein [Photobacterium halotolerans]|uniref:Uncharacterized protein n=1 Tax=Photobacterium halotolerans TaxID=265726 RepID=A0A7X4WG05_9GAMM|nr:hypothetical protein [Photobacterium halotolerans]NAW66730.1 hypothetical protein [Photobacterium halotolerans]
MNNEKRLWNLSELEAFGLNRATIRKRFKAVGLEPMATGPKNAPLYDVIQAAMHLSQRPVKQTDAPDLMGFKTAAELRAFVQAEREKLSLGKDAEDLVTREAHEIEIALCIAGVKSFKEKVITRIESAIPTATPQQLEDLERLFNFDLKAVADELETV